MHVRTQILVAGSSTDTSLCRYLTPPVRQAERACTAALGARASTARPRSQFGLGGRRFRRRVLPCLVRTVIDLEPNAMSRTERLRPLAALLAVGLTAPAFAGPSTSIRPIGPARRADGSWVLGNGQIITPAGNQVDLGTRVRAKAVALNPDPKSHTAAVLTMGASQAVEVFDTRTGVVLQNYHARPSGTRAAATAASPIRRTASTCCSARTAATSPSPRCCRPACSTTTRSVSVPPDNSFIKCFPNSPIGDYGRSCGTFYSTSTSYPGGLAFSQRRQERLRSAEPEQYARQDRPELDR